MQEARSTAQGFLMLRFLLPLLVALIVMIGVMVTPIHQLFTQPQRDHLLCERNSRSTVGRWPNQTWVWTCHAVGGR